MDLTGVFIPTATPFDQSNGNVDLAGFRSNLERWAGTSVRGFVVGGSTGEAVLLESEERTLLWRGTRDLIPDDCLFVAGTGAESTRSTIRLCQIAADAGADSVLVQPPAFYKGAMNPETLRIHFHAVADVCPIPVILYQVPLRLSTLDFPTGLVAELSKHENIVGIKDSRGKLDLVGDLVEQCVDGFQVLVGNGALLYPSLEIGAVGGILGVANLMPAESAGIEAEFRAGQTSLAGELQERVAPVHDGIIGGMGVPGVKKALDLLGYYGGDPRSPLRPLADSRLSELEDLLVRANLLTGSRPGS